MRGPTRASTACLLTSIIIAAGLAGCLGGVPDEIEPEVDLTTARVVSDGVLTILTYDIYGLSEEMVSEFTNATGITVEFIRGADAGTVLDTAILSKGAPLHDLIIGIDNSFLQVALRHQIYQPANVQVGELDARALAPYSGEMVVPYDFGSICFNFDTTYVDGQNVTVPTSLWDFTGEDWDGRVVVQNPRTSSPGRAFLAATTAYFGTDADASTDYGDWWSAMADNNMRITSGWTEAYEMHYSGGYGPWTEGHIGDAQAVVSYCHSPGVEAWYAGNWTQSAALDLHGASFLQVEYAGIAAGAAEADEARQFIEYLLSEAVNSQMPTQNLMYSALAGHDLPEDDGYRYHSVVPVDAELTPAQIGAYMDDWLDTWDAAVA